MARDPVAEVRERTDVVELVGQYVQLRRAGRSFKGLCPFHQEKTPSFIIFPDSQNFHCFGCGKGGDVFTFYQSIEHVEFREALQELAKRAGVELSSAPTVAPEQDAHRAKLLELIELAAGFFHNILVNSAAGAPGREAFAARGLDAPTMERFRLGYAIDGWDPLLRYLTAREVDLSLAAEAGLLQTRESGGYYDRFRGRLIYPIRDREGQTMGFGGRIISDGQPKYLNSPQSSVFDKSTLLYGLDLATDDLRRLDRVVIVEGYMDAIAAHQFGYSNVVATMGTALTDAQVGLIKRFTKNLVLALDSDAAGQLATLRGLDTLREALDHEEIPVPDARGLIRYERKLNAEISIVQLPEGKDPDELIRRSPDLWPDVVAGARPFLDFLVETVASAVSPNDARGKSEALARLAPVLATVRDPIVERHHVGRLSSLLAIPESIVLAELRRTKTIGSRPAPPRNEAGAHRLTAKLSAEDYLIALLLRHRLIDGGLASGVAMDDLIDARNRALLSVLQDTTLADLDAAQIISGLDDSLADHAERLMELIGERPAASVGHVQQDVRQAIERTSRERVEFLMRQLDAGIRLAQENSDLDSVAELSRQKLQLSERRRRHDPPISPYFIDSRNVRRTGSATESSTNR